MGLIECQQAKVFGDGAGSTDYMLSKGNQNSIFGNQHMPDTEGCGLDGTLADNFGDVVNGNPST